MKSAYFWIIFLVIIGGAIGFYLFPTKEEVALLHLKSQQFSKAENFYLDQYNKGVRTPTIIYELSILYEKQGDLNEAIRIIKEFADEHPEEPDVFKRLAELYYLNNQFEEYGQTLVKMSEYTKKLEPDILRELQDYYSDQGEIKKQEAVLNEIISSGKGDEDDYAELAGVYAEEKEFDKAAAILKTRRTHFADKNTTDMILFELWISSHLGKEQSEADVSVVAAFLKEKNNPKLTFYILNLFRENYPNLALQLVKEIQPLIEKDTSLQTAVLLILWDHPDQKENVRKMAAKLEVYAKDNPLLQNFLFDVYLDKESDEDLLRLIQTTPAQQIEERKIIDIATLDTIRKKTQLLKAIQDALGHEYLEKHPLRALALAIGTQQPDAHEQLHHYIETHSLGRTDRFFLFRLAAAAKFQKEALELGAQLPPYIGMQEEDMLEITEDYIQMKKADVLYPTILAALSTIGSTGESALALLNIALHHPNDAANWIQKQKKIKETTLKLFFQVANDNKEYPLAFSIAETLVKEYPSVSSKSSYALALVETGKVEEGITQIRSLYAEHPLSTQIQREYLSALIIAVKHDKQYIPDLSVYMANREQQGNISEESLRDFGYIYLDTLHDFPMAQKTFFTLANRSPVNSVDVQTLVYLWGPHVTVEQGDWIENHALKAPTDEDLAYWLENLNFIGRFQSTIRIFQQHADCLASRRTYFAYMQALSYEKCKDALKQAIHILFPRLEERKHLEELATYAEIAEYPEARVWIWQKLADDYPNDPLTWQALGRALFDVRENTAALLVLERFFAVDASFGDGNNQKYYESLFEYAEVLRKLRYYSLSKQYYKRTLNHIADTEEQTLRMNEIAAQCYYQLEKNTLGLYSMIQFFELSGKDSDSTASYANMLMDNGFLKTTQTLLDRIFGK